MNRVQNFNEFLDMFFSSQYFIVVIAVLAMILIMLIAYLIKLQYSYKVPSIKQEEPVDLIEEAIKSVNENESILNLEALNNTVNHVKNELMPGVDFSQFDHPREEREEAVAEIAETKTATIDTELKWD